MRLLILVLACIALASAAPRSRSHKRYNHVRMTVDPLPNAPKSNPDGKIVGGTEATPHEFPHQVAVIINGGGFCGGSIISANWVLTAGHCATPGDSFEVTAGAHHHNDNALDGNTHQKRTVSRSIRHASYNPLTIHNDIALLQVATPFTFNANVDSVNLATNMASQDPQPGAEVIASGWGKTCDAITCGVSPVLRKVTVPIISNAVCAQTYGTNIVYDGNICISAAGGKGTCNGDSGGPLHTPKGAAAKWTTYGITSFGSSAGCLSGAPDAFSRVSYFRDWIRTNSGV